MKTFYLAIKRNKPLFSRLVWACLIINGYFSLPFDFMEKPLDVYGILLTLYIYVVIGLIFAAILEHAPVRVFHTTVGLTAAGLMARMAIDRAKPGIGDATLTTLGIFLIATAVVVVGTYLVIPRFKLDE